MNNHEITIRDMNDDDLPEVSRVVCACYVWLAGKEGYTPEETACLIRERGSIEALVSQQKECHFMVADAGGKIKGIAATSKNIITKLYIDPEHFRKGIGSQLFDCAEKHISSEGYNDIFLGAFPVSAGFYEAKGMELEEKKFTTGGPIKGRMIWLYRKEIAVDFL
jgi:ribosomal protein S18 acetylase RimI-like enzyme